MKTEPEDWWKGRVSQDNRQNPHEKGEVWGGEGNQGGGGGGGRLSKSELFCAAKFLNWQFCTEELA